MAGSDLRDTLLALAFPRGAPSSVRNLLPAAWDPRRFGGGPIFSSTGAHRFYAAASGESAFDHAVATFAPTAAALLASAPAGVRRMVDTDGVRADVYLDDLHQGADDGVMCRVVHHPSGDRSELVLGATLPTALAALGTMGMLATRRGDRQSILWITEAKHTGRVAETDAIAASLFTLPEAYGALQKLGVGAYIDGLEIHPDGSFDLTPGFR